MLDSRLAKTEAGRAEIRARALPLSRAARNLLLVIDASKPAGAWLGLVAGVTPADLEALVGQGLIAPAAGAVPAAAPAAAPASPASGLLPGGWAHTQPADLAPPPAAAAPAAVADGPLQDRAQLYTYLSGAATKLLGPFKGYAFALEVERCDSLAELQALARQLVERVQKAKGDAAADAVRQALGLR